MSLSSNFNTVTIHFLTVMCNSHKDKRSDLLEHFYWLYPCVSEKVLNISHFSPFLCFFPFWKKALGWSPGDVCSIWMSPTAFFDLCKSPSYAHFYLSIGDGNHCFNCLSNLWTLGIQTVWRQQPVQWYPYLGRCL